jgi:hypothetical protein
MVLRTLAAAIATLSACALVGCGTTIGDTGPTATPSPSATPTATADTSTPAPPTPTPVPGPASVTSLQVAACPPGGAGSCSVAVVLVTTDGPGLVTLYLRYYVSSTPPSAGNRLPSGASSDGSTSYQLTNLTSYRVTDPHATACHSGVYVYEYVEAYTSPGAPQGHAFGSKAVGPC